MRRGHTRNFARVHVAQDIWIVVLASRKRHSISSIFHCTLLDPQLSPHFSRPFPTLALGSTTPSLHCPSASPSPATLQGGLCFGRLAEQSSHTFVIGDLWFARIVRVLAEVVGDYATGATWKSKPQFRLEEAGAVLQTRSNEALRQRAEKRERLEQREFRRQWGCRRCRSSTSWLVFL